jgi:hypothetical protein
MNIIFLEDESKLSEEDKKNPTVRLFLEIIKQAAWLIYLT